MEGHVTSYTDPDKIKVEIISQCEKRKEQFETMLLPKPPEETITLVGNKFKTKLGE